MERLYPDPKSSLSSIYAIISHELKDQTVLTSKTEAITLNNAKALWQNTLNVKWPEAMSFKGISKTKRTAYKIAAMKCLQWLEMHNKLKNGKPIVYDKEKIRDLQLKPVDLNVSSELLYKMTELIETYETVIFCIAIFNICKSL